jgi:hypothetical protein
VPVYVWNSGAADWWSKWQHGCAGDELEEGTDIDEPYVPEQGNDDSDSGTDSDEESDGDSDGDSNEQEDE